ncbi:uncharacterized protein LTR77_003301 [Saxophila tyrrhenica]|uniref:BTB domain-containing protein n=1 Tax=Saxophila tyrrhenica TaxID=1690608 RepID=A0AAV9PJT4_9PEZI|nr:hypothetical protein LTR77_003301 [Saxophila tyrrhenica]
MVPVPTRDSKVPEAHGFDASLGLTTINVGMPSVRFYGHQPLLQSSEFFRIRSKSQWQTGQAVDLPDVGAHTFNTYGNWLYSRNLPTIVDVPGDLPPACGFEWNVLASAYILGEMLLDAAFRDTVIDSLQRKQCRCGKKELCLGTHMAAEKLFAGTAESSMARKWAIDVAARSMAMGDVEASLLSKNLIDAAQAWLNAPQRHREDVCFEYHCHGEVEECYMDNERCYLPDELHLMMKRPELFEDREKVRSWIRRR